MARGMGMARMLVVLALLAAVNAQTDLPNLSTATQATELSTLTATGTSTDATSATTGDSTATSTATGTETTGGSTTTGSATTTTTGGSSTTIAGLLTGLPTIAGAGIPEMVIPYTADAPFMQKSNYPEGTVFIAVGAVLAFLGACVLLWRVLVAWSITRSVKRAARIAIRGGAEKNSGWGGHKSGYYKEHDAGSSMSLDALTSAGKPIRNSHFQDDAKRNSSAPPAGLFFSPTAQATNRASSAHNMDHRGSGFMPAGYYASPSAEPAGGRSSVALGNSLAPYARTSAYNPSPPGSPSLPASRSTSNYYGAGPAPPSRDGLRTNDGFSQHSREQLRTPVSRDGYSSQRNSNYLYTQPSSSSLMVGTGIGSRPSSEHLGGQRAPSAVLDELFENHGHGPRERF